VLAKLSPPAPNQLRNFLLGKLPPDEFHRVETWVQTDPHAAAALDTVVAADSVTHALSTPCPISWDAATADSVATALQQALAKGLLDRDRTVTEVDLPLGPPETTGLLFGDYRTVREIGRGGMGVVYEAVDTKLDRRVAVKVLGHALNGSAEHRHRFFREAKVAAALRSEHIVNVYQVGEEGGQPYIAMELLEGVTLEQWLRAKGQTPTPAEAARIIRELLTGLAAAHQRGLVHRDIKPSNLWVEAATGRLKVVDFGLGRGVTDGEEITRPGVVLGTPAYIAPEQASGKPVSLRADLFSVGAVVYRLFAGQSPFQRGEMMASLAAVATYEPPRPAGVPDAVWAFVRRLLSKAPEGRPSDAAEALQEWQRIEPQLLARPPIRRRWPLIALGFGGMAAALVLGVIIIIWQNGRTKVVVAPDSAKTVIESTKDNTVITITPESPPPTDRRVTLVVDLTPGYDGKTGELTSGHQPKRGDKGTVLEVPDVGTSNRWRVLWDADKSDPHGSWVSSDYLKFDD
jgi:serine/threonine protein kinase